MMEERRRAEVDYMGLSGEGLISVYNVQGADTICSLWPTDYLRLIS